MKSGNVKKILILDICDTLYDSNTTFDFLNYYLCKNKKYILTNILRKNIFIKLINRIIYKLTKQDLMRYIFTKFLENISVEEIEVEVEEFYNNFLKKREKRKSIKLVKKYLNEGFKIIVISGTYDFIALKIGEKLGFKNIYATELERDTGKYTGRILKDMLIKKEEVLEEIIDNQNNVLVHLLTDNITDYPLVKYTKKSNIVITKHNKKFWQSKKNEEKIFFLESEIN